jgi:2-polyprenyl-6-methoxyphenol hydroxylase-like FAD-dependent oxidoreductase
MVGGGFREGLHDALVLTQTLQGVGSAAAVPGALARYQELRLTPASTHVTRSELETTACLACAATRADQ